MDKPKESERPTSWPELENERPALMSLERWDNPNGSSTYVLLLRTEAEIGEVQLISPAICIQISQEATTALAEQFGTLVDPCIVSVEDKPL